MENSFRVSQRAPKSCLPCRRRKMRCSRDLPCGNCISRDIPEQCRRESVILSKSLRDGGLSTTGRRNQARQASETSSYQPSEGVHVPEQDLVTAEPLGTNSTTASPADAGIATQTSRERPGAGFSLGTTNILEAVAWGSHREMRNFRLNPSNPPNFRKSLSDSQEDALLDFHHQQVAWTHNVLHMPEFMEQCSDFRKTGQLPDAAWLSVYYAVLSLTTLFMNHIQEEAFEMQDSNKLAEDFYNLALETIYATDFTASHSINSLQAICIVMPCAYAFGDTKRMMVLLSIAVCSAQQMGMHRMAPISNEDPKALVDHEVRKRVWCFLCIQDSYLISFKKAYNIVPAQCSTPLPANCVDGEDQMIWNGQVFTLPPSHPTQNSYMLLLFEIVNVARALYDETCQLTKGDADDPAMYERVLAADEKMVQIARSLPIWLRSGAALEEASRNHPFLKNMSRTFRISFAHLRIKLHRSFFSKGIVDKRYYYSEAICLDCARSILKTYQNTAPLFQNEIWTIPAHVISGCIIITISILFSEKAGGDFSAKDQRQILNEDQALMEECLRLLECNPRPNLIAQRGTAMINELLRQGPLNTTTYSSEDAEETHRLINKVENSIRQSIEATEIDFNASLDNVLCLFDL